MKALLTSLSLLGAMLVTNSGYAAYYTIQNWTNETLFLYQKDNETLRASISSGQSISVWGLYFPFVIGNTEDPKIANGAVPLDKAGCYRIIGGTAWLVADLVDCASGKPKAPLKKQPSKERSFKGHSKD